MNRGILVDKRQFKFHVITSDGHNKITISNPKIKKDDTIILSGICDGKMMEVNATDIHDGSFCIHVNEKGACYITVIAIDSNSSYEHVSERKMKIHNARNRWRRLNMIRRVRKDIFSSF